MKQVTYQFEQIAAFAGFKPEAGGKLNLPATQETADALARAATEVVGPWAPGDEPLSVTLTGPGPVWGYLAIAHALHGRCVRLDYAAPNATLNVWSHGV